MTFPDTLRAECDRMVRRLMRHRERYLRAWVAATGIHPTEAMLEERMLPGGVTQIVVRRRVHDQDLVDRLARLLKEREWACVHDDCQTCGNQAEEGHAPGCEVAGVLGEVSRVRDGGREG